jgi:hypothetical protein
MGRHSTGRPLARRWSRSRVEARRPRLEMRDPDGYRRRVAFFFAALRGAAFLTAFFAAFLAGFTAFLAAFFTARLGAAFLTVRDRPGVAGLFAADFLGADFFGAAFLTAAFCGTAFLAVPFLTAAVGAGADGAGRLGAAEPADLPAEDEDRPFLAPDLAAAGSPTSMSRSEPAKTSSGNASPPSSSKSSCMLRLVWAKKARVKRTNERSAQRSALCAVA